MRRDGLPEKPKEIKSEDLNGVYNELANILDIETALMIYDMFRGQQITFPVQLFSRDYIFRQIRNEYDGRNVKNLATKYGYTEKWIRKILKDRNKTDR